MKNCPAKWAIFSRLLFSAGKKLNPLYAYLSSTKCQTVINLLVNIVEHLAT